ncbi:27 kDa hemolymph protein [Orussus abietinus]|uniref:27 kDa hemolymph protein n=1 Tax=Orussus abietinus TaxID=222816 RepID=UPI0006261B79|nr:27 kDa hemolymph protein [Orussus abietinus]XP_012270783.1 27 kDa hemolymph protein [Orussus abietinus]
MKCKKMGAFWQLITLLLISVIYSCEGSQDSQPSNDELLEKIPGLENIPGLNSVNASALPTAEDAKNLLKKKCDKYGGPKAFENALAGQEQLQHCVAGLVNVTVLQNEMEKAKPEGELDTVFKNYCRKSPLFKNCLNNFANSLEPCFTEKERDSRKIIQNVTDSLLNFICFKEGDRIALFISAGGPECIQQKQAGIQDCINGTFGSSIPSSTLKNGVPAGIESLPTFTFDSKDCTDIVSLQTCVVKELETCTDPTTANIVDSLFNFIKKVTPCDNLLSAKAAAATGDDIAESSASTISTTITVTLLTLVSLKYL